MILCPICGTAPRMPEPHTASKTVWSCDCDRLFVSARFAVSFRAEKLGKRYEQNHWMVFEDGMTDASAYAMQADRPGVEAAVEAAIRVAIADHVMRS